MILIKIADAARTAICETELSEYAKSKLSGVSNEKRRQEIMLGERVRRELFSSLSAQNEPIELGEHGKPYLPFRPDVSFNVSHSGSLAAGIIATEGEGEVGIDVELIDPVRGEERKKRIMRRAFTPAETAKVLSSADPASEFYAVWTRKEAYLKCTGEGITRPLVSVDTEACDLPFALVTFTATDSSGRRYALSAALPVSCDNDRIKIEQI